MLAEAVFPADGQEAECAAVRRSLVSASLHRALPLGRCRWRRRRLPPLPPAPARQSHALSGRRPHWRSIGLVALLMMAQSPQPGWGQFPRRAGRRRLGADGFLGTRSTIGTTASTSSYVMKAVVQFRFLFAACPLPAARFAHVGCGLPRSASTWSRSPRRRRRHKLFNSFGQKPGAVVLLMSTHESAPSEAPRLLPVVIAAALMFPCCWELRPVDPGRRIMARRRARSLRRTTGSVFSVAQTLVLERRFLMWMQAIAMATLGVHYGARDKMLRRRMHEALLPP